MASPYRPPEKSPARPTTSGTSTFTVQITDSLTPGAQTTTHDFTLVIAAPVSITTTSLPATVVGSTYTQSLSATGGTTPYTWTTTTGQLPQGVTLASDGTLSGKPTATGTFTFTVKATDSGSPSQSATQSLSIIVVDALTITHRRRRERNCSRRLQRFTRCYWRNCAIRLDGRNRYATARPLARPAGTILGTPTAPGTSLFSLQAADSSTGTPQTATHSYSITIIAPLTITTASLPNGLVGTAYSQGLNAIGGTSPYIWTVSTGQLPAGLSLAPDGTLSGTPTAAGSYTFTLQVTDSVTPAQTATQQFTVSVVSALSITTTSLPPVYVGQPLSVPLTALGGSTPYIWTLATGQLPNGATLTADGTLSGVPTEAGSFTFTVQVADSAHPDAPDRHSIANTHCSHAASDYHPRSAPRHNWDRLLPSSRSYGRRHALPLVPRHGLAPSGAHPQPRRRNLGHAHRGRLLSHSSVQVADSGTPTQAATQQYTISIVAPLDDLHKRPRHWPRRRAVRPSLERHGRRYALHLEHHFRLVACWSRA